MAAFLASQDRRQARCTLHCFTIHYDLESDKIGRSTFARSVAILNDFGRMFRFRIICSLRFQP